jgi:hypothetical protein
MPPILFYFFTSSELDPHKIDQIVLPLRSPPIVHHFLSLRRRARVFLVGCCVVFDVWRPPKATTYFFLLLIFVDQFDGQTTARRQPHTFHPGRLSSPRPLPPSTPTFGWLLCPSIKRGHLRPMIRPSL